MPGSKLISGFRSCKRFWSIRRKYETIRRYFIETQRKNFVKSVETLFVLIRGNSTKLMMKILNRLKSMASFIDENPGLLLGVFWSCLEH